MNSRLRVAVLMGGPSPEYEVSIGTGRMILDSLPREKYDSIALIIPREGKWFPPQELREYDVAFIAMHGTFGEDGTIQGLLGTIGLPYTGSGVLASALAMDKLRSAQLFSFHGLKVPRIYPLENAGIPNYSTVRRSSNSRVNENEDNVIARLPCVIKPVRLGSSVGVSIVKDKEGLGDAIKLALGFDKEIMAQEFIEGLEVTCGVLDEGGDKIIALPPTLIKPRGSEFFDYQAKYTAGAAEEITPAPLKEEIIKNIQAVALKAHKILGCAGMSRTDLILRGDDLFVLETNTIPGMTETSLYPQAAKATGIAFPALLDRIIDAALNKEKAE